MQRSPSGRSSGLSARPRGPPSDLRPRRRGRGRGAAAGLRRQRRHLAVRRIDDERRPVIPVAIDHPELVVVAGGLVVRVWLNLPFSFGVSASWTKSAKIASPPSSTCFATSVWSSFSSASVMTLVLPLRRPGHRRDAVVRPDALQIGLAVSGARDLVQGSRTNFAPRELPRLRKDGNRPPDRMQPEPRQPFS